MFPTTFPPCCLSLQTSYDASAAVNFELVMSPTAEVVGAVIGKIPGEQYQRISIFVPPAALIRRNTVYVMKILEPQLSKNI